jgi:hypothetical protein
MADNTQLDSGSGGDVIATDDISGVKHQRVKLEFGGDGVATEVDHGDPLPTLGLTNTAALGLDANLTSDTAVGYNPDHDSASEETITNAGGSWLDAPLTSAETVDLVSDDAADALAGTGARSVKITGLSGSYAAQTETVNLNGTGTVASTSSFIVVYRIEVTAVGSGATNAGTITAQSTTSAKVFAAISPSRGRSAAAVWCVREGATGMIHHWESDLHAAGATKYAGLRLEAYDTQNAPTWTTLDYMSVREEHGTNHHDLHVPLVIPERTLLRVQGDASADNCIITSQFSIVERIP